MAARRASPLSRALAVALLLFPTPFAVAAQDAAAADAPPIRVVGPISQPNGFIDPFGEATGFGIELLRALGERLGREIEVSLYPNMQTAIDLVAAGDADIVYGAVPTPDRRRALAFSQPYTTTNVVLFALKEREDEIADSDLSNLRIGVRRGSLSETSIVNTIGVAPVLYDTQEETLVAINTAAIDLVAAPEAQWERALRLLRIENQYVVVGEPLMEGDISIGVDLRQPQLLAAVDGALGDFAADGGLQALSAKWFGSPQFWMVKKSTLIGGAAIGSVVVLSLLAALWGRARLRDIERRDSLQREKLALSYAEELRLKNEHLKNNHDEMERILFAVAHDLKSPIVTVRGFAGVMEEAAETADVSTMHSAAKRILAGTDRLGLITDALLAFGSFGRSEISRTDLDLARIMANVSAMLEREFDEAGVTLAVRGPLATLNADESQVLRLMLNLVGNALRYGCPRPGMTIDVSTEAAVDGIIVSVRDHGPGVPENMREQVFRLFQRYGAAKPDSTGLGLAIVQKIVEKHGGRCWIEAAPGGGGLVRAFFPNRLGAAETPSLRRKSA